MRVVAYSRRADSDPGTDPGIARLALDDLLAESDAVSLHLPLTAATRGLFDHRAFARMRPGALFINAARGGLVVEADLMKSLVSGHLGGAGLDVLGSEPPAPDNPLLAMPNVVLSPHVAGIDSTALEDMAEQAARCVVELYRGGWPERCVLNEDLRPEWRW
jgi:phosphoglycerate dehydrogenase-like enzyme